MCVAVKLKKSKKLSLSKGVVLKKIKNELVKYSFSLDFIVYMLLSFDNFFEELEFKVNCPKICVL